MSWVLAFVGFAALILLHELGHFLAAKAVGMQVEKFSLFFGPMLVKVQRGETTYGIGPIPLGGYVKISGMNPAEELPPEAADRAYHRQPVWKRIVVIAAGPAMNLLIAFVLIWGLFAFKGQADPDPAQARAVSAVEAGSPADGRLRRTVVCPSFRDAIELVRRVADVAEELDHHPDIDIRYRTVHLTLWTHDRGGVTEFDLEAARRIDRLLAADSGNG